MNARQAMKVKRNMTGEFQKGAFNGEGGRTAGFAAECSAPPRFARPDGLQTRPTFLS